MQQEQTLPHEHGALPSRGIQKTVGEKERFSAVAEVFKQLSDMNRVRIFWLLCHREECLINIAALTDMTSPAVSYHLNVLAQNGLITCRRDGRETFYRASDTEECATLHRFTEQIMTMTCPEEQPDYGAPKEDVIRRVHNYLLEKLDSRTTIQELADRFLMNPTTLKQEFKRVYGTSLANHIRLHRLAEAARLLTETESTVGEIAQAVGYETQSHFTAAFRAQYGCTPTKYRKNGTPSSADGMHCACPEYRNGKRTGKNKEAE